MVDISKNLASVRQRIANACEQAGRPLEEVGLVAVTKTFPEDAVRAAYDAGHRVFGESRVQEALPKIAALAGDTRWHFIGRVQRNKLRKILAAFDVVHGIDSTTLAAAADRIAGDAGWVPKVFLQVNLGREESKGGFAPEMLEAEIPALLAMSRLEILGLMAIPPPADSVAHSREWFAALRNLRDRIEQTHRMRLPELSMGMSDDFEAAILEGSTCVRVGSAIFGSR